MPDPTYEDVYEPPVLDTTGQDMLIQLTAMVTKLQGIIDGLSPTATGVSVSNTGMHIVTEDDVQGAISELDSAVDSLNSSLTQNELGARVDISSYTTTSNLYTCPSDGFVGVDLTASTTAKAIVRIFGATGTTNQISIGGWANSTYGCYTCYVRKGMKLMVATLENNGKAFFIPLE